MLAVKKVRIKEEGSLFLQIMLEIKDRSFISRNKAGVMTQSIRINEVEKILEKYL